MRIAMTHILGLLLTMSFAANAQQITPQSDARCGGAQSKAFINWSQFHFDACHTGYNPYEIILGAGNVGRLGLDWKYKALAGAIKSSPAVVDSVLYFGDTDFAYVYALDAWTGATDWFDFNQSQSVGSPAVAYGNVYYADGFGPISFITAVNAANGLVAWTVDTDIASDVTVASDTIYVASAHDGLQRGGNVYALRADTGGFLWQHVMADSDAVTPAVVDEMVYVQCINSPGIVTFCALDAHTGATVWQFSPGGRWSFYPAAVSNGTVYTGALETIATDSGFTVFSYLVALDTATGAVLWQHALAPTVRGPRGGFDLTTPAVADGVVYIGIAESGDDSYGYMYALNAQTGAFLWKYKTGGGVYSSAAVANGVVYFGSDDKNIYALDARTGALLWNYTTGAKVVSSPAVANGMLFIGSEDTYMYAFHLPDK